MRWPARPFHIRVGAVGWSAPQQLHNGPRGHLALREDGLWLHHWLIEPSRLERDLVRIAFAIYAADRLVKRPLPRSFATPVRQIEVSIEVGDVEFWQENCRLVKDALAGLCDDLWDIQFVQGPAIQRQLTWLPQIPPTICQYSGGLDSVAGAVIRACEIKGPIAMVTAFHQSHQGERIGRQLAKIEKHFSKPIQSAGARTTFGPLMRDIYPRFDYQEPSQRCRAFLFLACGGATASALGSDRVEVFENGAGAINLPLMSGMAFGSRATRGCHPRFLRAMTKLVSKIAGRAIEFVLPFATWTKAEMVRRAAETGISSVLEDSLSCVHPLRVRGQAKQCGLCPACIGRRQAFLAAGLASDRGQYLIDVFDPTASLCREKLDYLAAIIAQAVDLVELTDDGSQPANVRRHLIGTDLLRFGESPIQWTNVLRRYRDEWFRLIHQQHAIGQRWAGLLPNLLTAA